MSETADMSNGWPVVVEPCIHSGPVADCMSCWVGQALRNVAENKRLRDALEEVTRVVIQESEDHRFGSPGYDMTLDHLHDVAISCREVLDGVTVIWGKTRTSAAWPQACPLQQLP